MISETTKNMTIEEAAEIGALLLNGGAGQISDDGDPKRPWLTVAVYHNVHAGGRRRPLRSVRVRGVFVTEKKNGRGWRFGAWGNDAPVMLTYLLRGGLKGFCG